MIVKKIGEKLTFILNYHKTGLHVVGFSATVKLGGKVISKHAQCVIFGLFYFWPP